MWQRGILPFYAHGKVSSFSKICLKIYPLSNDATYVLD